MVDDLSIHGRKAPSGSETDGGGTWLSTSSRFGDIGITQRVMSNNEDSVPMFLSPSVDTPLVLDRSTRTLVPPERWWENKAYKPIWSSSRDSEGTDPIEKHNFHGATNDNMRDYLWYVRTITAIKLRWCDKQIRELVRIHWQDAWIFVDHMQADPERHGEIEAAKSKWRNLDARTRSQQTNVAGPHIWGFLARTKLHKEYRFYVTKVLQYLEAEGFSFLRVRFMASWEHCGAFTAYSELWGTINRTRIKEAKNLLNGKKLQEGEGSALQDFIEKCEDSLGESSPAKRPRLATD